MTVGERIKYAREIKGVSQTELANKIKIRKQNLYKYENNIITNIPSDKIESIAIYLGVSPAYLMGWENIDNSSKTHSKSPYKSGIDASEITDVKKMHLLNNYDFLNERGKEKLLEYSEDLVNSSLYIANEQKEKHA